MSLSIAIASIVTADIALVALLAFVMSRAARLTPHISTAHAVARSRRLHEVSVAETARAAGADVLPIAA
jgi:hypothetical protein